MRLEMTTKTTVIPVSGLQRGPNRLNCQPGSLNIANNCVLRRQGVLQPLEGNEVYEVWPGKDIPVPDTRDPVRMFVPQKEKYAFTVAKTTGTPNAGTGSDVDDFLLTIFNDTTFDNYSSVMIGTTFRDLAFRPGETHMTFHRNRHFITTKDGPLAIEALDSGTDWGTPRISGLPPPVWISNAGAIVAGQPAILSVSNYFAYRATFLRFSEEKDSFQVMGAPTSPSVVFNPGGTPAAITLRVYFWDEDPVTESDWIVLYRTAQQDSVDALGDDYREVCRIQLTSTDITNEYVEIQDTVFDSFRSSGAPLYTNSLQEGATRANYPPPLSKDICTFKDTTFYATRDTWPAVTLSIPAAFGDVTSTDRATGIGTRGLTGDITIGGTSITNVSSADAVGLKFGQAIRGTGVQAGTIIGTPIPTGPTYSVPLTIATTAAIVGGSFFTMDQVRIDGTSTPITIGDISGTSAIREFALALQPYGIKIITGGTYYETANTIEGGVTFVLWVPYGSEFEVALTNGQNYSPRFTGVFSTNTRPILSISDKQTNRLYFSKTSLPEAVTPLSYIDVGTGNILKMWSNTSAMFVLSTDGLWRVTGDGTNWNVDQIDPTVRLLHPDCVGSLGNDIYAWVSSGLAQINESGAVTFSTDAIGPDLDANADTYLALGAPYLWGPSLAGDNYRREIWLNLNQPRVVGTSARVYDGAYIFNLDTKAFTTQTETEISVLAYAPYLLRLLTLDREDVFVPSDTTVTLAQVEFNPITAGDPGYLKGWIDLNWFLQNIVTSGDTGLVQGLFDGETSSPFNIRTITSTTGKKLHFLIPRRCSLKEQLIAGFQTLDLDGQRVNFDLLGLTIRSRVASETFKR